MISLKKILNEAKFKSPDYIISTTPASKISPIRLAHADVSVGLKMADKLKNYTLNVRHFKLVHANGKVALKLTPEGKTAVRVRTENDPKYLQLIQKTVNDIVADYANDIKESVNEAAMNPVKKVVNAILKKHKIEAMKTYASSVRGAHNIINGGYRYQSDYFLDFHKVPQDVIEKVGAEMKKAGVKGVDVRKGIISADFTKNGLSEATLTEKKYYITYNRGRGQGKDLEKEFDQKTFKTTNKPKVFNSYNDAKKYAEKMEKMFRNSIGGGTAYWVSDEKMNPLKESKSDYEVYHKSYTSAIEAARAYAEKKGYEINNDDAFTKIGMGPRKPSEGKTNRFDIELSKDGKVQRKKLQIQVYGMRNSYELNAYIQ